MPKKLKDIAKIIDGELVGDGEVLIKGVSGIKEAKEGDISFLVSPGNEGLLNISKASSFLVPKGLKTSSIKPLIKVDNPSLAFSKIAEILLPEKISLPKGIHKSSTVSKNAKLGNNVAIGPYVVIEDGSSIGDNTVIYPFCYVGKDTRIGKDCLIYPNVTIREETAIGDRVIIHSSTVIGSDGFGYDTKKDGTHVKIPQLGTVVIEDDVEIGACATIDRARFAKTVIGVGSKIDNLVQIAHNVILGPHCLIAAQSGIAGSCEMGRNVVLGGRVGIVDHVKLGDFVKAGAGTGISKSFPKNTVLFWYPAKPVEKMRKILASIGLLPKLYERVGALEDKIKTLEK